MGVCFPVLEVGTEELAAVYAVLPGEERERDALLRDGERLREDWQERVEVEASGKRSLLWEQVHWGRRAGTAHTDGRTSASFRNVAPCMDCLPVSFRVSCPGVTDPGAQTRLTASVSQFITNAERPSRKQGRGWARSTHLGRVQ